MAEQQIPKLVASLVEHQSAFAPMATKDAQWVIQNAKAAIALFVQAVESRQRDEKPAKSLPLLTLVGTIKVRPATQIPPSEFFQVNTNRGAPVRISFIGDDFKAKFLQPSTGEGASSGAITSGVHQSVAEVSLRYHTLNQHMVDGPIIAALGGEAKAKIALIEFMACLQQQGDGEPGALFTNGSTSIFYVCDVVVTVYWLRGGWNMQAYPIEDVYENVGRRVFSRDL